MSNFQTIKRTIYWIEIVILLLVLFLGVFLTLKLVVGSSNMLESIVALAKFAGYLIYVTITLTVIAPGILAVSVACFCLYVGSLFYFAQTNTEKKYLKFVIPVSLVAVLFVSIGVFGAVYSGLASQGAGH